MGRALAKTEGAVAGAWLAWLRISAHPHVATLTKHPSTAPRAPLQLLRGQAAQSQRPAGLHALAGGARKHEACLQRARGEGRAQPSGASGHGLRRRHATQGAGQHQVQAYACAFHLQTLQTWAHLKEWDGCLERARVKVPHGARPQQLPARRAHAGSTGGRPPAGVASPAAAARVPLAARALRIAARLHSRTLALATPLSPRCTSQGPVRVRCAPATARAHARTLARASAHPRPTLQLAQVLQQPLHAKLGCVAAAGAHGARARSPRLAGQQQLRGELIQHTAAAAAGTLDARVQEARVCKEAARVQEARVCNEAARGDIEWR